MSKIKFEKIKYKEWDIIFLKEEEENIKLAKKIIDKENIDIIKELKNGKRSFVGVTEYNGKKIVMKQPRMKHDAFRMKMMTSIFEGEAFSSFKSVSQLRYEGFDNIYKPVLSMEIRKNGMVQDSWFLYYYEEGEICTTEKNVLDVLEVLSFYHKLGHRHSDAYIANFIENKEGKIILIDCRAKKNLFGKIGEYLDFVMLSKGREEKEITYPFKDKLLFKLSKRIYFFQKDSRKIFKTIIRLGKKKK